MICSNCYSTIAPMVQQVNCDTCGKPLHKECAINDGGTFCDACHIIQQEEGKKNNIDFEVPEVIRRSHIQTYKDCPHKFYKEVIEGIENDTIVHAQLGIDMHDLFEEACRGKICSPDDMLETFKPMFDGYSDDLFDRGLIFYKDMDREVLRSRLWQQAVDSSNTVFEVLATLPDEPYLTEEKIFLDVGQDLPKVSITMDRVDLIDGELEVLDWKTGTVMVGKKLSSDIQAPLYIKAIQEHCGIPVRKFTFYYLSENKKRVFERVSDDNYTCQVGKRKYNINLTDTIREVQHIFSQIVKGNFNIPNNTKSMYYTCKICPYRQKGMCEGADIQSWKQLGN